MLLAVTSFAQDKKKSSVKSDVKQGAKDVAGGAKEA